jgi:hypothetical protein
MTTLAALAALEQEVARLFPADSAGARALAHPLAELRTLLAASDGAAAMPVLDAVEDILESLLSQAGWP